MARSTLAEDDSLVYIELGKDGVVQLDGGRSVPLPDIPFPVRRVDLEEYRGGSELPLEVLVEGTLEALVRDRDDEKSRDYRRFLFAVEPNVDQLLVAEALTHAREDRVAEARDRFEALVSLCPDHATGWMNLGICAMDLARSRAHLRSAYLAEALEAFLEAVAIDDRLAPAHFYLGCLFRDQGNQPAARKAWRRCVALGPRESDVALSARTLLAQFEEREGLDQVFEIGCLAVLEGRLDEGARLLERVTASKPEAWQASFFLGLARRLRGEYEAAAVAYASVVAQRPDDAEAWSELGLCQLEQGRLDEAERSLAAALELFPESPRVLCNMGLLELRRGRRRQARRLFLAAQAMDPEATTTRDYLELVEELPA